MQKSRPLALGRESLKWLALHNQPPQDPLPLNERHFRMCGATVYEISRLAALGLWMSDMFHHISPAWIGLGVALVCLLPGVELVPMAAFNLSYPSCWRTTDKTLIVRRH